MNKVILMGRLTKDPEVRYTQTDNPQAVARYTLAVDRRFRRQDSDQQADFIGCVAFGKNGEFAEKYLKQGTKIAITGRIQTGRYTRQDGTTVYTTDVVVEEQEFAESKAASNNHAAAANAGAAPAAAPAPAPAAPQVDTDPDGFMNLPDGLEDELPFG